MFRAIVVLSLASAASLATAATTNVSGLISSAPWWERVTVTIAGNGQPQTCRFESSLTPGSAKECQVESSQAAMAKTATGSKDSVTRITFERRFSPGAQAASTDLPAGDTLLGQQVMALAIGAKGIVEGCKIVEASGDMRPEYGCKEAQAERFQAGARSGGATMTRQGTMTILVYGHSEHVV